MTTIETSRIINDLAAIAPSWLERYKNETIKTYLRITPCLETCTLKLEVVCEGFRGAEISVIGEINILQSVADDVKPSDFTCVRYEQGDSGELLKGTVKDAPARRILVQAVLATHNIAETMLITPEAEATLREYIGKSNT